MPGPTSEEPSPPVETAAAGDTAGGAGKHTEAPEQEPSTKQPAPAECEEELAVAEAALEEGKHEEAIEHFRKALGHLKCAAAEGEDIPVGLHTLNLQLLDGVATCLQGMDKKDEALEAYMATMDQAATYKRVIDEAMACSAVADVFAVKGAASLQDAGRVLRLSGNLNDKVIAGVGGTTIASLHHMLSEIDEGEFRLADAPPSIATFLKSESAQGWTRVGGEQCFGAKLSVLESIQWYERMAQLAGETSHVRAQALGSLGTIY